MSEISIVVCGPVDAGKSSLVGVLTTGELDDGRGKARKSVFNHRHELESGRTSAISQNVIKYTSNNNTISIYNTKNNHKFDPRIVANINIANANINIDNINTNINITNNNQDSKVVSLIDLAGHERYLKTTVFGVTGMFPDRGIVVIGANTGITKLTREHIGLMLCIKIPFIIIITKIDMAPEQIYLDLQNTLKKLLHRNAPNKTLYFIGNSMMENMDDYVNMYINTMKKVDEVIPVITISNKNGYNINNLHRIIYNIPQRDKFANQPSNGTVLYIDCNYSVPGIGLVVSGTVKDGIIHTRQKMYMGPYNGIMVPVVIRSIHNNLREDVSEIGSNIQACFAIKFIDIVIPRNKIKKGFVLVDNIENWKKNIVMTFIARVKILHHSSAIENGYCPVVHCGPIKQSAYMKILNNTLNDTLNEPLHLKTGDSNMVSFTFTHHPELIEENMILFFRDGSTKGVGEVVSLCS
jgi:GTPase